MNNLNNAKSQEEGFQSEGSSARSPHKLPTLVSLPRNPQDTVPKRTLNRGTFPSNIIESGFADDLDMVIGAAALETITSPRASPDKKKNVDYDFYDWSELG